MTAGSISCTNTESAVHAAGKLEAQDMKTLPVMSESSSTFLGTVTAEDLCNEIVAKAQNPNDVSLENCINQTPICCNPSDDVEKAVQLMETNQVYELPVLEGNRLVGVITMSCIMAKNGAAKGSYGASAEPPIDCAPQNADVEVKEETMKNNDLEEQTYIIAPGNGPCV